MYVRSPSFYLMKPVTDAWLFEGTYTADSMSGASPLYHNTLSGASGGGVNDYREAGSAKVSRYFDRWIVGAGGAISSEHDYLSRAGSIDARWSTVDRNTTLAFGFGGSADHINTPDGAADHEQKHTLEFLAGITQNLTAQSFVQSNLTYSTGHGYYSDPYKLLDSRPDRRRILAWLTQYQRYFPGSDAVMNLSYRYLHDSFGSVGNEVYASWRQALPAGFALTPSLRYNTQGAADFYHDPPFPTGFRFDEPYSADTRLASWGAFTPGFRIDKLFPNGISLDFTVEIYRQKQAWRLGSGGSPGIDPFSARWFMFGISLPI